MVQDKSARDEAMKGKKDENISRTKFSLYPWVDCEVNGTFAFFSSFNIYNKKTGKFHFNFSNMFNVNLIAFEKLVSQLLEFVCYKLNQIWQIKKCCTKTVWRTKKCLLHLKKLNFKPKMFCQPKPNIEIS